MKDCEGHDEDYDLSPTTRACKAYVALCKDLNGHDAYMDCGDVRDAMADLVADLMHLADYLERYYEGFSFYNIFVTADHHFCTEKNGWLKSVKSICISQAIAANLEDLCQNSV